MEQTEVSEGMRRLIAARRDMDELLAGFDPSAAIPVEPDRGGRFRREPDVAEHRFVDDAAGGDGGSSQPHSSADLAFGGRERGGDWELLALERRLAALEDRAERAVVHLESQAKIAEDRIAARLEAAVVEATSRIQSAVGAAELRLAAVDAAQEREERVRTRIEAARREAEERVRAAERRLVEVLNRVDRAGG